MAAKARTKNLFDPESEKSFKLSRSKVDDFVLCPRCFYLDRRLGIKQPSGPPFTLNSAVDTLLKAEFDQYRAKGEPHPYMVEAGIDAVPFSHPDLETWRSNFKGVQYDYRVMNVTLTGAVDDLWVKPDGTLIVVDYKATAKEGEIELTNQGFHLAYKRQMEFYQWLLRKNGFKVSDTGYFVYCNGIKSGSRFDNQLCFTVRLLSHTGSDHWVEPTLMKLYECLCADEPPGYTDGCDFCAYQQLLTGLAAAES